MDYLYNGVKLPVLPKVEYEYMVITYSTTYETYQLFAKASAFSAMGTSSTVSNASATVKYRLIDGVWEQPGTYTVGTAVWANHDISNDNGVVLSASDPIPVGKPITDPVSFTMGYQLGCRLRAQRVRRRL